ncbi:hypothetical protein A8C56_08880 [Niabella ginsenosidivorans]|uniref:Uncharacterized protein n=1 Tax=Niabella ginsenosidivorans TaxID=1176587 RepID=A0A1A9I0A6_9BACT|nr:hypothetical protein A8C56_08880 [Niabella ginsenosidivorans]
MADNFSFAFSISFSWISCWVFWLMYEADRLNSAVKDAKAANRTESAKFEPASVLISFQKNKIWISVPAQFL